MFTYLLSTYSLPTNTVLVYSGGGSLPLRAGGWCWSGCGRRKIGFLTSRRQHWCRRKGRGRDANKEEGCSNHIQPIILIFFTGLGQFSISNRHWYWPIENCWTYLRPLLDLPQPIWPPSQRLPNLLKPNLHNPVDDERRMMRGPWKVTWGLPMKGAKWRGMGEATPPLQCHMEEEDVGEGDEPLLSPSSIVFGFIKFINCMVVPWNLMSFSP